MSRGRKLRLASWEPAPRIGKLACELGQETTPRSRCHSQNANGHPRPNHHAEALCCANQICSGGNHPGEITKQSFCLYGNTGCIYKSGICIYTPKCETLARNTLSIQEKEMYIHNGKCLYTNSCVYTKSKCLYKRGLAHAMPPNLASPAPPFHDNPLGRPLGPDEGRTGAALSSGNSQVAKPDQRQQPGAQHARAKTCPRQRPSKGFSGPLFF